MSDSIKGKIQKLLALAESANEIGSVHEAEVATQKALHLLWENGLSEADVRESKDSKIEKLVYLESDYWWGKSYISRLCGVLAGASLCVALRVKKSGQVLINLFGKNENLMAFDYLFKVCQRSFEYAANAAKKENSSLDAPSFLRGCVYGLQEKIDAQKRRENDANAINAIVKSEKDSIMIYLKSELNLKIGRFRTNATNERSSLEAGAAVGRKTNLNAGLPAQARAQSKLLK